MSHSPAGATVEGYMQVKVILPLEQWVVIAVVSASII